MSFGRLVRGRMSGVKTLEDAFDKALLSKRENKLSLEDKNKSIENSVFELYNAVQAGNLNNDKFFVFFMKLWESVFSEHERGRTYKIYPSQLRDECARKLYYEVSREEYSDEVSDNVGPRLQRIFDLGTMVHIYVQAVYWSVGILKQSEVRIRDEVRNLRGRADGILSWEDEDVVLEVKTKNSFQFKKILLGPTEGERYQAGIYAKYLGISKTAFFYFNKDTQEIKVHLVSASRAHINGAMQKLDDIKEAVENLDPPSRDCRNIKEGFEKGCPFATKCFKSRR